jgi:hypothetical protein
LRSIPPYEVSPGGHSGGEPGHSEYDPPLENRHTLVAELAESGAGDAMLSRYSHIRMEAKRRAVDEIAARRAAASPLGVVQ